MSLLNRAPLEELYGNLAFLSKDFDDSFIGIVEQEGKNYCMYDCINAARLLATMSDVDTFTAYSMITLDMQDESDGLFLQLPIGRRWFWNRVKAGDIVAWDGLHECIEFMAKMGNLFPVAIYDEDKIIDVLSEGLIYSDDTDVLPDVMNTITNMKNTDLLGKSPGYVKYIHDHGTI